MRLTEAIDLIRPAFVKNNNREIWADLGCGMGLFTKALATLVGQSSHIYAVDNENQSIKREEGIATIEFVKMDFINQPFPFSFLNGILMANSLHYVKEKRTFISKLRHHLLADGRILIVEYDTTQANNWVPYPIAFDQLAEIFMAQGFVKIQRIGERNSIYRTDKMYACVIESV